jgi:hypothetical protein
MDAQLTRPNLQVGWPYFIRKLGIGYNANHYFIDILTGEKESVQIGVYPDKQTNGVVLLYPDNRYEKRLQTARSNNKKKESIEHKGGVIFYDTYRDRLECEIVTGGNLDKSQVKFLNIFMTKCKSKESTLPTNGENKLTIPQCQVSIGNDYKFSTVKGYIWGKSFMNCQQFTKLFHSHPNRLNPEKLRAILDHDANETIDDANQKLEGGSGRSIPSQFTRKQRQRSAKSRVQFQLSRRRNVHMHTHTLYKTK